MIHLKKIVILPFIVFILVACENGPNKEQTGTVLGAIVGGALASNIGEGSGNTAAIIGGTMLGAYFGKSVGESLDRADKMYMERAQNVAYEAPIHKQINWSNPETGHKGNIIPTKEGTSSSGEYCREFRQTVNISGENKQAYGTACRQPDGAWKIVN